MSTAISLKMERVAAGHDVNMSASRMASSMSWGSRGAWRFSCDRRSAANPGSQDAFVVHRPGDAPVVIRIDSMKKFHRAVIRNLKCFGIAYNRILDMEKALLTRLFHAPVDPFLFETQAVGNVD